MRFEPDHEVWRGVGDSWTARVISPALLDAARGDRSLWADMGPRISGFDSNALVGARAWAQSERIALFHQGTGALGVPALTLPSLGAALAPLVLQPPQDLDTLVDALTITAIGVAIDALAAIPVVGPIARAIGSMALLLRGLSSRPQEEAREYLPPPQSYESNAEEYVMNTQLLPALSTNDWTRLFMPRVGDERRIREIESGWLLDSVAGGSGLGYIPGTQQITSATQAFWHKKSSRAGGSQAVHQDIGDFFPGPAQLMTAIDQQVQRPGPELWSVVPSEIRHAWRQHLEATMTFAYEVYMGRGLGGTGLQGLNEEHRRLIVQQLVAPLHVTMLDGEPRRGILSANAWKPKGPPDDIVEAFVDPWCDRLERRQDEALGTTAVAYADPTSAAFQRGPALRDKLVRMRQLLLESPARYDVERRDVIDPEYREALYQATAGDKVAAPEGEPRAPLALIEAHLVLPESDPQPPTGGVPFEAVFVRPDAPSTGGAGLAVGLGALGVLWAWRRAKGRRR